MTEPAIEVRGLRKSYGDVEAVRGIDLTVQRGQVFALLGPNGAGKTTTVEILEGHRRRSAGAVHVLGHDPADRDPDFKQKIGIVLQETAVNRYLTVTETIEQFRGFYRNPLSVDEIVELVELGEKKDSLVRRLSGGQQRRLDVATGIAGDPELLFLDEPTTGFDPSARRNAWTMIKNLKELGKTIFLTTHYMDEAQFLADEVAIINEGTIAVQGTPASISSETLGETRITFALKSDAPELPASMPGRVERDGESIQVLTDNPEQTLQELTRWSIDNDVPLVGLTVGQQSLEEAYLEVTKKRRRR